MLTLLLIISILLFLYFIIRNSITNRVENENATRTAGYVSVVALFTWVIILFSSKARVEAIDVSIRSLQQSNNIQVTGAEAFDTSDENTDNNQKRIEELQQDMEKTLDVIDTMLWL